MSVRGANFSREQHGATRAFGQGKLRYRFALELVDRLGVAPGPVVDAGCGVGELLCVLRERGFDPCGIDLSPGNVEACRELGFSALQADMNEKLPLPDERFDGAFCLEVVEHVVNAELLLSELARVVRPEGFLILSTPNVGYVLYRAKALRGAPPPSEGYHYRFWNFGILEEKLRRAGWRTVARRPYIYAFGYNRLRKLAGRAPIWWSMPARFEPLLARAFVIAARKGPG